MRDGFNRKSQMSRERIMKKTTIAVTLLLSAGPALSEFIDRGFGREDYGHGGSGGGNVEVYSKNSTDSYDDRDGQFKFIFGGAPNMGQVMFTHYNGSAWIDQAVVKPNGDLIVKGAVKSTQMIVDDLAAIWPDYVFRDDYKLLSIDDLSKHIKREGHLPGMPTAEDIKENGHDLGLVSTKTLEKVEELALYIIQLKQENDALRSELRIIQKRLGQESSSVVAAPTKPRPD